MTKYTLLLALGVSAFAAPAFAQQGGHQGYMPSVQSSDPCVLGTNTQPGACVGPVRVAPVITSQGSVVMQQQQTYQAASSYRAAPSMNVTTIAHHQAPVMAAPAPVQASGGCVPNYPAAMVGCNGNWSYAPGGNNQGGFVPNGYSQMGYGQNGYGQNGYVQNGYSQGQVVTQQYAPAPVQYAPAPAPVVYQQAPQYFAPAPVQYAPAPVQYAPAPVQYAPAPVQYAPAPVQYAPAPRYYAPQPQQVDYIQPSFFTGGITYGSGFPDGGGYSYGGGGGTVIISGGTRFSGVRERSPTPLIAPPMRRNQPRHAPPPKHCGHC